MRRLVLLSFFQAEAARKRLERVQTGQFTAPVIYGVEEPETSQHPENQLRIIEALQALSDAGEQVILTTHVPGLAGLVPVESLRFVDRCPAIDAPRVRNGTDDIYAEIASALGVFPTAVAQAANAPDFPRVAVCVEGYTDETALRSLGRILEQAGVIHFSVDTRAIFWVSAGGSSLHAWVERRYLDSLGIPQFYLCDSDRITRGADMKADTARLVEMLTGRPNCQVWVTRKREIENYLHPAALLRATGDVVDLASGTHDLDYCDIQEVVDIEVLQRARAGGCAFYPVDHRGTPLPLRRAKAKEIVNAFVMPFMTSAEVLERCRYTCELGLEHFEVVEWFEAIGAHLRRDQVIDEKELVTAGA